MKGPRAIWLTLFLALSLVLPLALARELDPKIVTSWGDGVGEAPVDIAVAGRAAFVCRGRDGVDIIDFSNFDAPQLISHIETSGSCQGIVVMKGLACVADEFLGLKIYDVVDLRNPRLLGSAPRQGWPRNIVISGSNAFIAAQSGGLQIYDISNPRAPRHIGSCEVPGNPARVAVQGNRAYLVGHDGAQVIDVTDLNNPVWLRRGPGAVDVVADADSAYVLNNSKAVDLSVPFFPGREMEPGLANTRFDSRLRIVANESWVGYTAEFSSATIVMRRKHGEPEFESTYVSYVPNCIALSGNLVYTATSVGNPLTIQVWDFSAPGAPKLVSNYDARTSIVASSIAGNRAALIERGREESWLVMLDISNPPEPVQLGRFPIGPNVWDLSLSGDTAVVVRNYADPTLLTFDVSNPAAIRPLGSRTVNQWGRLAVSGSYAFLYEWAMQIMDLSDPSNPKPLGVYSNGRIEDFAVDGSLVALAQGRSGVAFLDISNPASPREAGRYVPTPSYGDNVIGGVALRGHYAYMNSLTNFMVVDVARPESPQLVAQILLPWTSGGQVRLHDDVAYVGSIAVSIADPAHPVLLRAWSGPTYFTGFAGSYGFYVDGAFRVVQLDALANPAALARFRPAADSAVAVAGRFAYSADPVNGFTITDIQFSHSPSVIAHLDEARGQRVKVHGTNAVVVKPDFQLVNIENPGAPKIEFTYPGTFSDAAMVGDISYVSDSSRLRSFRINGPNGFQELGSCPGGSVLLADGEYLYMCGAGLVIVDISLPGAPGNLSGQATYGEYETAIAKSGQYIYTAGYFGLAVYDVSNPRRPWLVGKFGPPPISLVSVGLVIAGQNAYLLESHNALNVFDISNPFHPRRVGGNANINATGLSASADTLYLISRFDGLKIADLFRENPQIPSLTMLSPMGNSGGRLRVRGPSGAPGIVQYSNDLVEWTDWAPVLFDEAARDLIDPAPSSSARFYRSVRR